MIKVEVKLKDKMYDKENQKWFLHIDGKKKFVQMPYVDWYCQSLEKACFTVVEDEVDWFTITTKHNTIQSEEKN